MTYDPNQYGNNPYNPGGNDGGGNPGYGDQNVGAQGAPGYGGQPGYGQDFGQHRAVVSLPPGDHVRQRPAAAVDGTVNLGSQPAS